MVRVSSRTFDGDLRPLEVSTSTSEAGDDTDWDETSTATHPASNITYDNDSSLLTAENVQDAIDELVTLIGASSSTPVDHGAMGSTETIDAGAGDWHRGTLDDDVAITVSGFTVDEGEVVLVKLEQDGTGGHGITWDGDVIFTGDDQPAQGIGEVTWYVLWSDEGDTIVYGSKVGGSSVAALDDLTDVAITAPATADRLRYNGSAWVNSALKWVPVTTYNGTNWLPAVDGSGNAVMSEA